MFNYTLRELSAFVDKLSLELSASNGCVETRAALAAGNTIVLKPAEQTPVTAMELVS